MTMTSTRPVRRSILLLGLLATISISACSVATMATEASADQRDAGSRPDAGGGAPGDPGSGGAPSSPGNGAVPGDTKPGSAGPEEPSVGEPAPQGPPPGDGALHVEPVPGIVDSRPHAIDGISVAADGRSVTVYWWGGVDSCYGLDEVRVDRDAGGPPTITVLEGTLPDLGEVACIDIALLKSTTITLDEPIYLDGSPH